MSASATTRRPVPMEVIARYTDQVPVDLRSMARDLGVRVTVDPDLPDSISGKIEREGDGFHVTVNGRHSPQRQRFTLAHELAHRILHTDLIGSGITDDAMYRSDLRNEEEQQADAFAAELLMPAKAVRAKFKSGARAIADMAQAFDVSYAAAGVRMRWLKL